MAGNLRIRLMGPLEVTSAGTPVGPAGRRRRSLLALLALRANEVVSTDELVAGIWGERGPRSARAVVQTYVSTWRKALDAAGEAGTSRITTGGGGYRLTLAAEECDLLLFRQLADQGRLAVSEGRHAAGRIVLEESLALWRGAVLPDLRNDPFHGDTVRSLEDVRVQVIEDWVTSVLESGTDADLPAILDVVQKLRAEQPWRERPTELLLWTLFRQGRQRDALAAFEATRRALADDLGVDPGPGLRRMHERVLRQDAGLLTPAPARPARVALRPDAFVGREREMAEVAELLHGHRLVTLTGPAGAGKSRLAEEVAVATGMDAVLVDLASVDDPGLVPARIAARLGLAIGEPLDVLVARLAHRPLLLVLDNLEHLPGVATTVSSLLRSTTELRILATSREPVHLAGEQQYAVSPLPVPSPEERDAARLAESASVQLLAVRARESDPGFRVDEGNAEETAQIVRSLDGLPLALEIVAPWLRPLGLKGVLDQLRRPLDIQGRRDDSDRRHRTLRDAISWSYERLSRDEQRLLARLSVLRGGGDLEAVRAVGGSDLAAPVVDVLVDLVDRHLVQPPGTVDGSPRFRLLETVRQFAAERLVADVDEEVTKARAAAWFGRWAVWLAANSEGPETASWQAQAVADADNLRASMDFLERTGQAEAHLQLVVDTMALWFEAGHEGEGEGRLERALSAAPKGTPARPMGLAYLAWLVAGHDRTRAAELAERAATAARRALDEPVLAFALQALGEASDDADIARAASVEALELAHRLNGRAVAYGPTAGEAIACGATHNFAEVDAHRSLPTAIEWQQRALLLCEEEGDRRITAANSARLGLLHLLAGDVPAATGPIQQAAAMVTGPLTARWEDIVAFAQAQLLHHRGRTGEARAAYRALIASAMAGRRVLHVSLGSCGLVDALIDEGLVVDAAGVLRSAEVTLRGRMDARHSARLQVRKARLMRLNGMPAEAAVLLHQAESGLDEEALTPEMVIWLVEKALQSDDPDEALGWADRLWELSRRTGVHPPPWERALLPREVARL
jgi:predicted ATPase/DNA-binding SARP family transcriptional activator